MRIIQDFIPVGRKNRPMRKNGLNYITIHNTGNSNRGAGAKAHANYVKSDTAANLPVSWHYTVDDKEIYQHLPDNETAYHAGDGNGKGNTQSIGIEICENSDCDLFVATDNAAWLAAQLCDLHNIPTENIAQHYDWSRKDCPHQMRRNKPYSWKTFIEKIKSKLQKYKGTPEEITVDNAIVAGLVTDREHWLGVLNGTITAKPEYIKILIDRAVAQKQ